MKRWFKALLDRVGIIVAVLRGANFIFINLKDSKKKQGAKVFSFGMTPQAAFQYMFKISHAASGFEKGKFYSMYEIYKVFHTATIDKALSHQNVRTILFFESENRFVVPEKEFLVLKGLEKQGKGMKALRNYKARYIK